jgi:hypothetical protein
MKGNSMDYRKTKIRILSREHSKAFQEAVCNSRNVYPYPIDFDKPYLYVDDALRLAYGSNQAFFDDSAEKEITFPVPTESIDTGAKMKVRVGDYVVTKGMNEAQRRDVVQALIDCGAHEGEGFRHCNWEWYYIRVMPLGIHCTDDLKGTDFSPIRELTLADLLGTDTAWNGEGVPPVGTHCEVTWGAQSEWHECVMLTNSTFAYLHYDMWHTSSMDNAEFRPLQPKPTKTERELFVESLSSDIGSIMSKAARGELYDKGYRKVSESKESE